MKLMAAMAAVLLLAGCAAAPSLATSEGYRFHGSGIASTPTFALSGGDYSVSWFVQSYPQRGCSYDISLSPETGTGANPLVAATLVEAAGATGTAFANVALGSYYLRIKSGCVWSVGINKS